MRQSFSANGLANSVDQIISEIISFKRKFRPRHTCGWADHTKQIIAIQTDDTEVNFIIKPTLGYHCDIYAVLE